MHSALRSRSTGGAARREAPRRSAMRRAGRRTAFASRSETLNGLMLGAQPAWEGTTKVLDGESLAGAVARLRAWMEPSLAELQEYRRLYPGVQERPDER